VASCSVGAATAVSSLLDVIVTAGGRSMTSYSDDLSVLCSMFGYESLADRPALTMRSFATENTSLLSSQSVVSYYPQDSYALTDPEYSAVVEAAEVAIFSGSYPQRIPKGSSGSYFVRDVSTVCRFVSHRKCFRTLFWLLPRVFM